MLLNISSKSRLVNAETYIKHLYGCLHLTFTSKSNLVKFAEITQQYSVSSDEHFSFYGRVSSFTSERIHINPHLETTNTSKAGFC